tara:strand:+ start:997 stop:1323 length:327 start_codon:yes stop_codon:yes gene_type:complete
MATTHKLLSSGQLGVAGTPATIYDPSSGKTGMIKTIVLHNTQASSTEVAEIFFNGTADSTRMLNVSLAAGETFEWALGHMIVMLDAELLKGQSTTASKVNYFIFGAEE